MIRVSFGEYSILCIRRIWVDWPGMGLPIFPSTCFGPNELGLCLGCYRGAWVWHGAHCSFGLANGILGPFLLWNTWPISLSPSVAPQPLCTDCVSKGCNYYYNGCYFHVSVRIRIN